MARTVNKPKRVQLRRTKGWRKPEGCIVVARPTRWGNPYPIGSVGVKYVGECVGAGAGHYDPNDVRGADQSIPAPHDRLNAAQAVALYRDDLTDSLDDDDPYYDELRQALTELRGHDLACWCPLDGSPCHADVLLELANR